jgi:hypothetical protein
MTITISKETQQYLEAYLLQQGLDKEAMSDVVEEALEDFLFKRMLDTSAKRNADLSSEEAEALVEQVVTQDRQQGSH